MTQKLATQILKIPGWLSKNEGLLLYELSKKVGKNGRVVEIGSFLGKSTAFIAIALKEIDAPAMFAVDPHQGVLNSPSDTSAWYKTRPTFASFKKNIKDLGLEKFVIPIKKTSLAANKNWRKKIALLHVDGLHEYEYAKGDLEMWLPHLKHGGIVVCHDAFGPFPDVFRAVKEEIFANNNYAYIAALDSQIIAIKGRPKNLPESLNFARSKFFLTLASNIWHYPGLPMVLRAFIVNRLLKIFFLNKFMGRELLSKIVSYALLTLTPCLL